MPENGREHADDRDRYEREQTTDLQDTTPDKPTGMPLHTRIFIGLTIGIVAGAKCVTSVSSGAM